MRFTITWIFPFVAGLMTYHFIFTHDQEVMKTAEHRTRAPASIQPQQTVSINLTESVIAQMEHNWNDLPLQAEAKRETRGWRMTKITANSSFYKAGLREGDLITEEFLDIMRNSNAQLVVRMEKILNRITR